MSWNARDIHFYNRSNDVENVHWKNLRNNRQRSMEERSLWGGRILKYFSGKHSARFSPGKNPSSYGTANPLICMWYGTANPLICIWDRNSVPTHERHDKRLNHFHLSCLRKLLKIRWQDKIPDIDVLKKARMQSMHTLLKLAQLR